MQVKYCYSDFRILAVFFLAVFFAYNNSHFWHFQLLTQTDHFAKAIAFSFTFLKIISFFEYYLFFFSAVSFATTNSNVHVGLYYMTPYGPARAFIAKLLRKSPYEGRT